MSLLAIGVFVFCLVCGFVLLMQGHIVGALIDVFLAGLGVGVLIADKSEVKK